MGDSSDKNDKTQLLSESQVIEVKPVADKNDRSVWKGVVVGADEFAPPAPAKSSGPGWLVLAILAAGVLGAGGYLWWSRMRAPAAVPDAAAKAIAIDAVPQDAAPVVDAAESIDAAPDALGGDAGIDAGVATSVDAGVKPIKRKLPAKHVVKRKTR